MKKLLAAFAAIVCAATISVQAQDTNSAPPMPKMHKLTPEQQQVMDTMLAKYDTNKDGKLDKTERAAMSQEDKDAMTKAGLGMKSKKPKKEASSETSTNAPQQ
jgi:hypothetical protein